MLQGMGEATCLPFPNLALMSAATCSQASAFRLDMMTWAPCSAKRSAIALPMPFVEPVIKAVLPDRSNKLIFPPDRKWRTLHLKQAGRMVQRPYDQPSLDSHSLNGLAGSRE